MLHNLRHTALSAASIIFDELFQVCVMSNVVVDCLGKSWAGSTPARLVNAVCLHDCEFGASGRQLEQLGFEADKECLKSIASQVNPTSPYATSR